MTYAIEISDLKKRYDGGFEALKGVDLKVEKGDFFALLGPNGAGKSTTIGILCSLVNKTSGRVSIFGADIDEDFAKAKKYLGVVPQEFNFNVFESVFNVVVTQAGFYGISKEVAEQRAEKYLKQLGLWDKKDAQSRMLSGGMKRRLMIARALIHEPEVLILDEPTAGVDIELRRSMWEFIKGLNEQGTTIILTTHYLEEAEQLCRNIAIINSGEIVENTSVKALLKTLNQETFILDLDNSVAPDWAVEGYRIDRLNDASTIEVEVIKGQSLNRVFSALDAVGINVLSMRNKSNRLEELFVKLIKG
ncbi:ABC transporter ATP-binding protein [Marinomonas pollencensis]|uniref:ABC-2 type transport system ATP-binding protein n=1 Tax=Marinomonas pollencensis TaxID=491954 RepID=A0A3E0DUH9_9GAMM|nr:ABC transporter ATP-binding protein [Marinomonas pollencensis]REG85782.1 ABC-2 type transport system ATP-binding protein [Marinomonas pollencensis]